MLVHVATLLLEKGKGKIPSHPTDLGFHVRDFTMECIKILCLMIPRQCGTKAAGIAQSTWLCHVE